MQLATVAATTLEMTSSAAVLAAVLFSLVTTLSARETHTEAFYPDHPVSGRTSIEITSDTEVRI